METILTEYDYNRPEVNTHIKDISNMFDIMNNYPNCNNVVINILGLENVSLSGNYNINEIMEICKTNTNSSLQYETKVTILNEQNKITIDIIPMIESA